jgi:hypothetical protein
MEKLNSQPLSSDSRPTWWISFVLACGLGLGFLISEPLAIAQKTDVPWECSEYSSEAQARCMKTLLDLQQEKIANLEAQLKAQEGTVNELKEKMDRQQALARRDAQASKQDPRYPPPPYVPAYDSRYAPAYGYGYAPVPPIGIYLQPPWRVPRYYGYGPGYWGQPGLSFNFRFGGGKRHRHR